MTDPFAHDLIDLRDGPTLPWPALTLALQLEARGATMRIDNDKLKVGVGTGAPLTAEEQDQIRHWREHLKAIIEYRAPC